MSSNPPDDYSGGRRELELAEESSAADIQKLEPYLLPSKAHEARTILARIVSKSHSGPIPSAEELEHLERVLPGSANRCFVMAEREQNHRHTVTENMIDREFRLRGRGQYIALFALVLLLLVVGFLGYLGDTKAAAALGAATIVGVVAIFATGKIVEARDDEPTEREEPVSSSERRPVSNQQRATTSSKGKSSKRRR